MSIFQACWYILLYKLPKIQFLLYTPPTYKIKKLGPLQARALGRRTPGLCLGPALWLSWCSDGKFTVTWEWNSLSLFFFSFLLFHSNKKFKLIKVLGLKKVFLSLWIFQISVLINLKIFIIFYHGFQSLFFLNKLTFIISKFDTL